MPIKGRTRRDLVVGVKYPRVENRIWRMDRQELVARAHVPKGWMA